MYLSAKKVLSTILLNSDTDKILEEYIVEYVKLRPYILSSLIESNGLYHVFVRTKDPSQTETDGDRYEEYNLIKSFLTFNEAEDFVLQNGYNIIKTTKESNTD